MASKVRSRKKIVNETRSKIQVEFRQKTGLIVDQPKPGFGNSNDGNTARRFFQNPEVSAEITKIDVELIKKLHTILVAVSCGHQINVEKFRNFTLSTAKYFVEKYPWYNMSPTLHKFLIHGSEIITHALLPIGQLSEEAQEARNKDFKSYREHFSRKCSREKSNEDIFNRFLISSDPIISNMSKHYKKKSSVLPQQVLDLLMLPKISEENNSDDIYFSDSEYED